MPQGDITSDNNFRVFARERKKQHVSHYQVINRRKVNTSVKSDFISPFTKKRGEPVLVSLRDGHQAVMRLNTILTSIFIHQSLNVVVVAFEKDKVQSLEQQLDVPGLDVEQELNVPDLDAEQELGVPGLDGSMIKRECVPGVHSFSTTDTAKAPDQFTVRLRTSADLKNDISINIFRDWSPVGADRFYQLMLDNYYNCAAFFRVVPGMCVNFNTLLVHASSAHVGRT